MSLKVHRIPAWRVWTAASNSLPMCRGKAPLGPSGFAKTGFTGFQHSNCIFHCMVDNILHLRRREKIWSVYHEISNLSVRINLPPTNFIPCSRNLKLKIQYEMLIILERPLGSFRLLFYTHFKPVPPLKNLKAHFPPSRGFDPTWPCPQWVQTQASPKVQLWFSEFICFPSFPNMESYVRWFTTESL